MDAETFLAQAGSATRDYVTETVVFYFAGIAQLTYVPQYDGWISGWQHSRDTALGIAINVDCPAAVISTQGVTTGLVLPPANVSVLASQLVQPLGRWPFKKDDRLNARMLSAAPAHLNLFLSRWV